VVAKHVAPCWIVDVAAKQIGSLSEKEDSSKMKIAICARTSGEKGGIGVYTRSLLDNMLPLASNHEFIVFYSNRTDIGRFRYLSNVQEMVVPAKTKLIWDQVVTPYHAAKLGVDLIFHPKMSAPLLTKTKSVLVLHGSERFVYPQFSHKSDLLYFKTLYRLYMKRATGIISVSDNAAKDLIQFWNINPSKVRTVHLAPAPYFRELDDCAAVEAVRCKYNLPKRFILNVGLIYPGKNIPNLLRALKKVREHNDVKLVLAGTGRRLYEGDLRQVHELGLQDHVLLPGYVPHEDLVAFYNLAEAVVFPSFYESFGLISLEAMACGCPVVVSRTGGAPEAAGDAAIYVDPANAISIAEGIIRVLVEPQLRSELREKGLQNAKRFSWEKTAGKTLEVFESLAKSEGPMRCGNVSRG
jgi:glycosyltransferase involved in cell wall biosynthesis